MKKKLDTSPMENELKGGSAFFRKSAEPKSTVEAKTTPSPLPSPPEEPDTVENQTIPSEIEVNASLNQSIDQSTSQSTKQPMKQLAGKVINKPVAFYIPESINKKIDAAVTYFQDRHHKKYDRSAVVSAILGNPNIWTDEALDQMADNVTEQLTNRLVSRLSD